VYTWPAVRAEEEDHDALEAVEENGTEWGDERDAAEAEEGDGHGASEGYSASEPGNGHAALA
jgi:hypothetical protein